MGGSQVAPAANRAAGASPVDAPVFIVGCPRSGTTWVQLLLSQHPAVATAPETQIFAYYLDGFRRQWTHEHEGPASKSQGGAGLSRLLSGADFDDLCRSTASFVLDRIWARNPAASIIVEKSPRHALHLTWIRRLFPDARFLHVVRDPRDTVASLAAAAASWAAWAPRGPTEASRLWVEHVEAARQGLGEGWYRESRYETLREDPVSELGRMLEWLGVDASATWCDAAVESCRLDRLRKERPGSSAPVPGRTSPPGFFRKGVVGGWRQELSPSHVRVIEQICGGLMSEYGYASTNPGGGGRAWARVRLHSLLSRVRGALDWRLNRLIKRV